jgi:hypothetical protein
VDREVRDIHFFGVLGVCLMKKNSALVHICSPHLFLFYKPQHNHLEVFRENRLLSSFNTVVVLVLQG